MNVSMKTYESLCVFAHSKRGRDLRGADIIDDS